MIDRIDIVLGTALDKKGRGVEKCMTTALSLCSDFANETSALEQRYLDRGHICIMSPKGHPQLAGGWWYMQP
jgi:hypothetical protein